MCSNRIAAPPTVAAAFDTLDAPIERVTQMDVPMPYALHLEDVVYPTVAKVVAAVRRALYLEG